MRIWKKFIWIAMFMAVIGIGFSPVADAGNSLELKESV